MSKINSTKSKKQKITFVLGCVLVVLIALIILMYFILLTNSTVNSFLTLEGDLWSIPRIIRRTVQIDFLFLLLLLAFCLTAQRKIVVIYLRKFHLNTNIISPNNNGGLGKKIRIITLQDKSFPSVSSTRKDKVVTFIIILIIFFPSILIIYYLGIGSNPVISESNSELIIVIGYIIAYIIWLCITVLIFTLFYIIIHNKNKVMQITSTNDIKIATNKVGSQNFFIKRLSLLGTRSTVVETLNEFWKETISSLIKECNIAIIDITQLTDNIGWEIKECLSRKIPIILIYSEGSNTQLTESLNKLLLHLKVEPLSNIPILKYSVDSKAQLFDFRTNLIKIITEYVGLYRHSFSINSYHVKRLFFYLLLFLLSILSATVLTLTVGFIIDLRYGQL